MTTERLVTEYTADTTSFRRGARVYDSTLKRNLRNAEQRLGGLDDRLNRTSRRINGTRVALTGLTGYLGTTAITQVRRYAESWKDVERRLESIGVVTEAGQKGLVSLALRTRGAIGGTAAAVQRFSKSTGDGIEITTRRVETLQKLLASAGSGSSERSSVSLQLGQALQSGVLSGDEFRSIRENSPVEFLDALAKAAGVTRAELKGVAEDQRLTTDVVLRALDELATTADEKFGALAISGDEAFNVLTTGLTVYAGNVDQALSATDTLNGAMVFLGEYLTDAGGGAETMADALKIVGTVALVAAGSKGIGALNNALQRSVATSKFVVQEARKEVSASQQKLVASKQEFAASQALVVQRQAEVRARLAANQKLQGAVKSLTAAERKEAKATQALAGAQVRAVSASNSLAAAQQRLSFAARAATSALSAARGVLAFFGGPLGLAITAFTALNLLVPDLTDRLGALQSASGQAQTAMDRYAEASKKAKDEQQGLAGKVTEATQAMNTQARIGIQKSLQELEPAFEKTMNNIVRTSRTALAEVGVAFRDANGGFGAPGDFDPSDIAGSIAKINPVLGEVIRNLEEVSRGQGNVEELAAAFDRVRGVGEEAERALESYNAALSDGSGVDGAREQLVAFSRAVGQFGDQLNAIETATTEAQTALAFDALTVAINNTSVAAKVLRNPLVDGLADAATTGAEAKLSIALLRAALAGNTEEAERLKAQLDLIRGVAADVGDADVSSGITKAANEAGRLAENLLKASRIGLNAELQDEDLAFSQEVIPTSRTRATQRGAIENFDKLLKPKRASADTEAAEKAERQLGEARQLLLENGQKALFVEAELNAERKRLTELMPNLISLGLSRAEAEVVVNSELERTEDRLKRIKKASEEASASFADGALRDVRAAENVVDALGRISARLQDLAFDQSFELLADQFARIGSGSSGSGGGVGGFLGKVFDGLFGVKAATGGLIRGPGTATSDSIPALLSDGEYVVRASSVTPQTLPLLRSINNSPTVPRFAQGGQVKSGGGSAGSSAPLMRVEVHNHASAAKVETQPSPDGRGLQIMIWDTVSDGIMGGKFDRPNQAAYGLKRKARGN